MTDAAFYFAIWCHKIPFDKSHLKWALNVEYFGTIVTLIS